MINDEGEVKAMTKFEATKIIHKLLDSEVGMAEYEDQQIAKVEADGKLAEQYHLDNRATRRQNIDALQLAGMALTGEV